MTTKTPLKSNVTIAIYNYFTILHLNRKISK